MSVIFKIKNKKFIISQKPYSLSYLYSYVENLITFNDNSDLDLNAPLKEKEVYVLGIDYVSARGFECWYEKEHYFVRVNTPASRKDWQIALQFIKNLFLDLKTKLYCEDELYTLEDLEQFPYIHDIRYGIDKIIQDVQEKDLTLYSYGVNRQVAIGKKMVDRFISGNRIDEYEKLMLEVQYLDAHTAKQQLYKKGEEIIGVYVLSENIPTILPYKPFVQYEYSDVIDDANEVDWKMVIFFENEKMVELDYNRCIQSLNSNEYYFIDENQIYVCALNQDKLKEMIESYGVEA